LPAGFSLPERIAHIHADPVRNAITDTYGYANHNTTAYPYTEGETIATSAPKSIVASGRTRLVADVDRWTDACRLRSIENDVGNHGPVSTSWFVLQDRGNTIAVDTICACT